MRVQRATGSLAGWQREGTWVHELRPGCRSQKLGNCSFNESRVSPSPEAKLLRKSKSLPGTAAMQAACFPYELCSLCCGEVPYDLFPAQQDTSRRFRAAGHPDPILSPGTNHQKPDWCSAGSCHRASNLLQPLPPQGWAPLQGSASVAGQGTTLQPPSGRQGALLPGWAHQSLPSQNKDPHLQNLTLKERDTCPAPGVSLNP